MMSAVYTVLAVSKGLITVVETYAGVQSAMTRGWHVAIELASQNTDWVRVSPNEEKLAGGTSRWVLLDTSLNYVAVYFSYIEDSLKSRKDRLSLADRIGSVLQDDGSINASTLSDMVVPAVQPVHVPAYDVLDRSLPAGFNLQGKPILMGELLDDPYNAKAPENLTLPQQWALVIARAQKDPDWRTLPKGYSGFAPHADVALPELKNKTPFGELIMQGEIAALQSIYDDAMLAVNDR